MHGSASYMYMLVLWVLSRLCFIKSSNSQERCNEYGLVAVSPLMCGQACHKYPSPKFSSYPNFILAVSLLWCSVTEREGGATLLLQGAKKVSFTACYSGKLYPASTSPKVISTSLKKKLMSRIDYSSSVI